MSVKARKHKKRPVHWHDGFRVPSDEIPAHAESMYVEVPSRLKRKYTKTFNEIFRRMDLPEDHEQHLAEGEADELLIQWLLDVGIRWNWVDGNKKPLPQPEDDPGVYDELSVDEINFIIAHIRDGTRIPPPSGTA